LDGSSCSQNCQDDYGADEETSYYEMDTCNSDNNAYYSCSSEAKTCIDSSYYSIPEIIEYRHINTVYGYDYTQETCPDNDPSSPYVCNLPQDDELYCYDVYEGNKFRKDTTNRHVTDYDKVCVNTTLSEWESATTNEQIKALCERNTPFTKEANTCAVGVNSLNYMSSWDKWLVCDYTFKYRTVNCHAKVEHFRKRTVKCCGN
jgi:hypothetical protein